MVPVKSLENKQVPSATPDKLTHMIIDLVAKGAITHVRYHTGHFFSHARPKQTTVVSLES